jgi:hypothetical protein
MKIKLHILKCMMCILIFLFLQSCTVKQLDTEDSNSQVEVNNDVKRIDSRDLPETALKHAEASILFTSKIYNTIYDSMDCSKFEAYDGFSTVFFSCEYKNDSTVSVHALGKKYRTQKRQLEQLVSIAWKKNYTETKVGVWSTMLVSFEKCL